MRRTAIVAGASKGIGAGVNGSIPMMTKGGLNTVTRSLAIEYARKGIRFNAVAPGVVNTPMHADDPHDHLKTLQPMGSMAEISDRRQFLLHAALGLGAIGSMNAQSGTASPKSSLGPMKQIDAGVLNIGYADLGPSNGSPVILLHGWPYDIHSYAEVAPFLASAGYRVITPYLRGYGSTRFLSGETFRNGQQAALAVDTIALMDALRIETAIIAGFDWGARTADIVAALWPARTKALVSVSGYLIGSQEANRAPLPPQGELAWWYQFYFATERGQAGYDKYRKEFCRLIWQTASPRWHFDDATFDRSAAAFDNPDHVGIVIHNYRWRLGLAKGESKYDPLETKLAAAPAVTVPTITLEGDANGAPHPDPEQYAKKFTGWYRHRVARGGVGHNLPQEAPKVFAQAVLDVDGQTR